MCLLLPWSRICSKSSYTRLSLTWVASSSSLRLISHFRLQFTSFDGHDETIEARRTMLERCFYVESDCRAGSANEEDSRVACFSIVLWLYKSDHQHPKQCRGVPDYSVIRIYPKQNDAVPRSNKTVREFRIKSGGRSPLLKRFQLRWQNKRINSKHICRWQVTLWRNADSIFAGNRRDHRIDSPNCLRCRLIPVFMTSKLAWMILLINWLFLPRTRIDESFRECVVTKIKIASDG
jgi:hypothetical protein